MIQLTTLAVPGTIAMPRAPGSPLATTSDFALALATISGPAGVTVVASVPSGDPGITVVEPGDPRQAVAAGGTILPVAVAGVAVETPVSTELLPTKPVRQRRKTAVSDIALPVKPAKTKAIEHDRAATAPEPMPAPPTLTVAALPDVPVLPNVQPIETPTPRERAVVVDVTTAPANPVVTPVVPLMRTDDNIPGGDLSRPILSPQDVTTPAAVIPHPVGDLPAPMRPPTPAVADSPVGPMPAQNATPIVVGAPTIARPLETPEAPDAPAPLPAPATAKSSNAKASVTAPIVGIGASRGVAEPAVDPQAPATILPPIRDAAPAHPDAPARAAAALETSVSGEFAMQTPVVTRSGAPKPVLKSGLHLDLVSPARPAVTDVAPREPATTASAPDPVPATGMKVEPVVVKSAVGVEASPVAKPAANAEPEVPVGPRETLRSDLPSPPAAVAITPPAVSTTAPLKTAAVLDATPSLPMSNSVALPVPSLPKPRVEFVAPKVASVSAAPAPEAARPVTPPGIAAQPLAVAPVSAPADAAPLAPPVPAAAVTVPVSAPAVALAPSPVIITPPVGTASSAPAPGKRADTPIVVTVASPARPAPATQQPAAQAFAAAMFAAGRSPVAVDRDDPATELAATFPMSCLSSPTTPIAISAAGSALPPALDLARDDWMGSMIDRIETIRDDAGVRETRIRLTPDALGSVDVSIAQDDAGVLQVRFDADTPQARAILAEAAPRLAEMAEARGLKLGGAGVDVGADQRRQNAQQTSAPAPIRPASAANDDTDTDDSRIA